MRPPVPGSGRGRGLHRCASCTCTYTETRARLQAWDSYNITLPTRRHWFRRAVPSPLTSPLRRRNRMGSRWFHSAPTALTAPKPAAPTLSLNRDHRLLGSSMLAPRPAVGACGCQSHARIRIMPPANGVAVAGRCGARWRRSRRPAAPRRAACSAMPRTPCMAASIGADARTRRPAATA